MGLVTNDVIRWLILLAWLLACGIAWLVTFIRYNTADEFYYTRYLMGAGLPVARACALVLNLNSMLILFPVCRNLISYLRGSFETREFYRKNIRRQLDKNITFHKLLAYAIMVMTTVHIIAHCFNMQNMLRAKQETKESLENTLSNFPQTGDRWVNPIKNAPRNSKLGFGLIEQVIATTAGWTGAVLTLAFLLMISSSTEFLRRSYFETFWYSHHLFVLYYAMLLAHGTGGLVRRQTNTAEHDPKTCAEHHRDWPTDQCATPTFGGSAAASWKWCIFPLCAYFLERLLRVFRSSQNVIITKVVNHPSRVIELRMSKKNFKALPGQYIFMKCPSLSRLQWHPFTLTSAPEDKYFSVHIRCVGDWTNGLAEAVGALLQEPLPASQLPRIAVDGPFGTSSTDIFGYRVAICVAAGIGVTPFASVLKSIQYKLTSQDENMLLKKVYFFWVCSDTQSFEWFNTQLGELEQCLTEMGRNDFFDYAVCLTRGWSLSQAKNIYLQEEQELDAITGLMQKTHYGRPRWPSNFAKIAEDNPGERIGVFFCGPKSLSHILHKCCNEYSNRKGRGTIFVYNKENF